MSVPRNELIKGYHRCVVWCLATIRWSADLSGSLPLWSLCQAVDKFRWGTQTYHRESASNSAGKSPAKMIWYFCPEDGFLTTFLMPGPQQKPDTEAVQKKQQNIRVIKDRWCSSILILWKPSRWKKQRSFRIFTSSGLLSVACSTLVGDLSNAAIWTHLSTASPVGRFGRWTFQPIFSNDALFC